MSTETVDLAAIDFDELHETYLSHPKLCPCARCAEMDRRLGAMCVHPGCRKLSAPGSWRCGDHPSTTRLHVAN
ncbi:hypothetical protein [Nonomuraea sp. NPDC048901]|uniref:hypothetical protein n=1 Tax=Nonomuraea sp. NPDC048901 TaxID=3155627 RepID=UPI0033FBD686